MTLAMYGILVILILFIVLMVFNPSLSCFGRKLKSPLYPVLRKKKRNQKKMKTVDYGFDLGSSQKNRAQGASTQKHAQHGSPATRKNRVPQDYGFDLGGRDRRKKQ